MAERSSREIFGESVSRPRARRAARIIVFLLLLGIACGAIWWIDRGARGVHERVPATMNHP